jgi:hypothetical protein
LDLSHRRVLITQAHLVRYMGSEIVTLELARHFRSLGADVVVVTHSFGGAMAEEFAKLPNVRVFETWAPELPGFLESWTPEIAWVHHSLIPTQVLERADQVTFLFHHMSSILAAEFSMSADLECRLATTVLFESPQSRRVHEETGIYEGLEPSRLQVLGNPAPAEFRKPLRKPGQIKRITVVSNHIPSELVDALPTLRRRFTVELIGSQSELGATPRLVTPRVLADADAIITVGKTVQYSLSAGVPVYLYDHFGGPGWLTGDVFETAAWHNFSGRGFDRKSSSAIVAELEGGAGNATATFNEVARERRADYSLPERIDAVLRDAEQNRRLVEVPSAREIRAHDNVQNAFGSYVREWVLMQGEATNRTNELAVVRLELDRYRRLFRIIQRIPGYRILRGVIARMARNDWRAKAALRQIDQAD